MFFFLSPNKRISQTIYYKMFSFSQTSDIKGKES